MKYFHIALIALMATACSNKTAGSSSPDENGVIVEGTATDEKSWPMFDADSAYTYIKQQVGFGPRVPGTQSHTACRDYLIGKFKGFGADTVILQQSTVTAFDGRRLPMSNILARFNPEAKRRILFAAHYDTRPWADEDPDEANHRRPIDGANDGASGVAVILELARHLKAQQPDVGVDFLLTDVEDYGAPSSEQDTEMSWALGAQYFADNSPYTPSQRPAFGILLDMVGGKNAKFYREYFSELNSRLTNDKVWNAAKAEGITRFVDEQRGAVTDDHRHITRAGIPCIDIIECSNDITGQFPAHWHTVSDNIDVIDHATLQDVGATMMRVIYTEKQ